MKYYIVTGTSKGLGEAIAYGLINRNTHLFCISRTKNEQLIRAGQNENCEIDYYLFDLCQVNKLNELIQNIFEKIDPSAIESLALINNASVLSPIKKAENISTHDIVYNFNINIVAPFILTTHFLSLSESMQCKKMVVNISSGAAKKAYSGWSAYCSSKAALDMFSRVIGLEQSNRVNPTTIFSFIPGVIDTDMQAKIRETDVKDFESVKRFQDFKKNNMLLSPAFVSEKLIELMNKQDIIQGGTYDIRDLAGLNF